jgi:TATA-box binding protein (TBP) (component of TFIID and TFIIIB)
VCIGRGAGREPGDCRKITVAVFQSGKVIVTGAHTLRQIDDAYRFLIDDVVANHGEEFRKPTAAIPKQGEAKHTADLSQMLESLRRRNG